MQFDTERSTSPSALRSFVRGAASALSLACAAAASAGGDAGVLNCVSANGLPTVGARPGQGFVARVALASDLPLVYNSAIFRVEISRNGVGIEGHEWAQPFETLGPTDFSLLGVYIPSVIDSETLAGPTYPANVIDVEFANFLLAGDTGTGPVVDVELVMPAKIAPGQTFTVTAVPDTFGLGFVELPVATGSSLTVRATFSPDFNGDGFVGAPDLAIYLSLWGTPNGDLNGDGLSNSQDLAVLLAAWS